MKVTGIDRCNQFVNDVLEGVIPAPKTIKLACKRYKKDFKNKELFFDTNAANGAVFHMERFKHAKGRWQGSRVHLENWQCFVVCNIFGWKLKSTGFRRFRSAYLRVPRKNGKSFLAVLIALVMFGPDNEPGAEVYLGATTREDANELLFFPAKFVVENDKKFISRYGIEVSASQLVIPANFSKLKAVIKKPSDGASPHCAVIDEYHLHPTAIMHDTFSTGMGARDQPLLLTTTTAGSSISGPCHEMDEDCIKQLEGQFDELTRFIMIYAPDKKDKWDDMTTLKKVNPNIGVSVSGEYLRSQLEIAIRLASKQNEFRAKHVNEWVGASNPWMNMLRWQRQAKPELFDKLFRDAPAHGHVDLASRKDLAAIILNWKNGNDHFIKCWFFIPESALQENLKYQAYHNLGEIIVTPGNKTDQAFIEEKVKELTREYDVRMWSFDDYQGDYMMTRLMDEGFNVVNYGATVKNFSAPMKEVEALVLNGQMYNDGNQCMTWQIGNVVARLDEKDNIFPRKTDKNNQLIKIDGPVSLIASQGTWMAEGDTGNLDDYLDDPINL